MPQVTVLSPRGRSISLRSLPIVAAVYLALCILVLHDFKVYYTAILKLGNYCPIILLCRVNNLEAGLFEIATYPSVYSTVPTSSMCVLQLQKHGFVASVV